MTRSLLAAAALLALGLAPVSALEIEGVPIQGGLIIGKAAPGERVILDDEEVKVGGDGLFVIGFGRDQPATAFLTIRHEDGAQERRRLLVAQRRYDIQRIDRLERNMVTPDAATAARIAAEQARVDAARAGISDRRDFLAAFRWPATGPISGIYGSRRILNGEARAPHLGLDIAAPEGAPVFAPAGGVVRLAEPDLYLTGGTILLDHGFGIGSSFLHLRDIAIAVGREIRQGELLGHVGRTGRATGPHLHWGLTWKNRRLDPRLLLPAM